MVGFRHLAIRVKEPERSRAFYEALGLRFIGFRLSGVSMDLTDGQVNLTILPYEGPERRALEEGTEFVHYGFMVEDLAGVYRRLVAGGFRVVRDDVKLRNPHEGEVPVGSFKALDPDGNVVDISDRPAEWRTAVPSA